jgi:NRAMP (natural resistance-associated macrophage protein)-like metal ion transporter
MEGTDQREGPTSLEQTTTTATTSATSPPIQPATSQFTPSGKWWKDLLYFVGPGWMVSIAYVDPGNYQADIQAGSLSRYSLLCIIWWTSLLSIYVQILCVRLAYYGGITLSEAQARYSSPSTKMRYLNWFIAEFSTVITDLPEVIGIGIAGNVFFGWPYWVGVSLSLFTTMLFLMTLNYSTRMLEMIIAVFVAIMAVALIGEMNFVGVSTTEMLQGWAYGVKDLTRKDIFSVTGVVGAVVMPHNLYLHTAACQSRSVEIPREHVEKAVYWSSIEPVLPVIISFFINLAVLAIAAERVYGTDNADNVGLTDFCTYFQSLAAGCSLWGIALLAAGQSSAITTTYTGQYVMDGFLNIQLPIKMRAILTRLVAITPCIIISVLLPNQLNQMVNVVNALLSFLLPFAFTPLVMLNCNEVVMGENASKGWEKYILHVFAFAVWLVNTIGLSVKGGGFFGDWRENIFSAGDNSMSFKMILIILLEVVLQVFYAWWNWKCIRTNVTKHEIILPPLDEFELTDINEEREHEMI